VQSHFTKLCMMREDLASMGSPSGEDEFYVITLSSLPPSYDPYISALNATLSVLGSVLSSDNLMQMIMDEYECRNLGRGSKKEDNVAFSANDGGESQSRNPATVTIAENLAIGQGTAWQKAVARLAKAHKGRARGKTRKRRAMARVRVAERRKGRRLQNRGRCRMVCDDDPHQIRR